MAHASSSASARRRHGTKASKATESTNTTNAPSRRRSSAYDADFERHMIDNNIYPEGYGPRDASGLTPESENIDETRVELLAPRASLSPSRFPESAFRDFKRKNYAIAESTVKRNVIPVITGNSNISNEGDLPFTNMKSIATDATVKPVPDFFDWAQPGDVDSRVREDLSELIIPTKHPTAPIVPNFYLEAKSTSGGVDVAMRQALHGRAVGARAMHSL
ncbi:hypothetical protein B0T22DRAFT_164386 [Podospora appendiculata]|uniref:Uncharacterized protein n=1 Tax=Podospora appendiculata TaxID=314037 RepID=A0AAE0XAD0_9PEZI|nr:hypothetical protein B0T22DRAFT_164386 [Podospora appendiculata]